MTIGNIFGTILEKAYSHISKNTLSYQQSSILHTFITLLNL